MEIATPPMNAVGCGNCGYLSFAKAWKTLTMLCNQLCCFSDKISEAGLSPFVFYILLLNPEKDGIEELLLLGTVYKRL